MHDYMLENHLCPIHMLNLGKTQFLRFYSTTEQKDMKSFLLAAFGNFKYEIRKLMTYLESWGNSESKTCTVKTSCKDTVFKVLPYFTWPWSELCQIRLDDVIGSMTITIDICVQNDPENMCRTLCLWLLFHTDRLWPDLDIGLFKYDLHTHAVSFSEIYQNYGWVWAPCGSF